MAIIEQCQKCRRYLGSCPYDSPEEENLCKNYMYPIDNSSFFSNFLSRKGRIGKTQYLVIVIISLVVLILSISIAMGIADMFLNFGVNFYICLIIFILVWFVPSYIISSFARKRRCNDLGTSFWHTSFVDLFFRKGEDGLNENGTEPLKPFAPQVEWRE